jgi:predicted transposase/invertase (TIGR01784 family)
VRSSLDPNNDVVFKLLFGAPGSRQILTALLTAVLDPPSTIVVVDVRNLEILPEGVADKTIALDLHVARADGRHLDVEMQTTYRRTFRDRALCYWSRVFGGQLERLTQRRWRGGASARGFRSGHAAWSGAWR